MAAMHFVLLPTTYLILGSFLCCSYAHTFSNVSVVVKHHIASSETLTTIKVFKSSNQEVTIHKAFLEDGASIGGQYLDFERTDRTDDIILSNDDLSTTLSLTGPVLSRVGIYTVTVRQDQEAVEMRILILIQNASITPREYSTVVFKGESATLIANKKTDVVVTALRWRKDGIFQGMPCLADRSCTVENAQESSVYECYVAGEYSLGTHAIMNLIVRDCPDGQWGHPDCDQKCPRCFNGGLCSDKTGLCQCSPGFSGTNCEQVHGRNVFGQFGEHKCDDTGDYDSEGCEGSLICYPNPFGCVCPAGYVGLDCTEECEDGKFGANCKQTCHCQADVPCAKDTGVCEDNECITGWKGINCQVETCEDGVYGDLCNKECSCPNGNCREVEESCGRGCAVPWTGLACDQDEPGRINITYVKVNPNVETTVTCSAISNPVTRKANLRLTFGGDVIPTTDVVSSVNDRSYSRNNSWVVTLISNPAYSTAMCSIANLGISSELILAPFDLPYYRGGNPLTVSTVTSAYIHVTWRTWSEEIDSGDGPIVDYQIRYGTLLGPWIDLISTGTTLGAEFRDLTPDTEYYFQMRVVRDGERGEGLFNGLILQKTLCCVPGPPVNLNVSRRTLTELTIEWDSPYKLKGNITKYELQYQAIARPYLMEFSGDIPKTVNINNLKDSTSHTITNLAPSTIYEIQVSAYTSAGQGAIASVNGTTALYTDLEAVNVNEVSTNRKETTAEIILPALTQQYATGYRIRIRSLQIKPETTVPTISRYEDNPDDYITAELDKKEEDRRCTIGDGKIYGEYYNAPLQRDKKYEMFINTLSEVGEEIQEVSSSAIPLRLVARNSNGAFIVIIFIIIAAVTIVTGTVWYTRKNMRRPKTVTSGSKKAQRHSDYEVPMDLREHVETDDNHEMTIQIDETSYYNVTLTRNLTDENAGYEEPIQLKKDSKVYEVSDFHYLMTKDKKDLAEMFLKEFTMLQKMKQLLHTKLYEPVDVSIAEEYDHSRVKLTSTEPFADCRCFNANYIKDSKGNFRFIAAQGPQGKFQVIDFWRMIWQNTIKTVVMLGETSTENTDICSRYWPEKVNMSDVFDDITVVWMESLTYDTYTVRKMTIIKQDDNICHTVQQVHFHQWVYKSVPEETTDLISIIQKVKVLGEEDSDPILVHCSDGNGATGTFIAIFCLMDILKESATISVYDFVKNMRKDRPSMVQTKIQYQFIFEALQEAQLIPEGSRISTGQLKVLEDRSLNDKAKNEYEVLQKMKQTLEAQDDNAGRAEVNIHKNRFKDIIPCDKFRPILKSEGLLRDSNDYINATLFENYGRRFVMTQAPMKNTLEDFWRLVYDYGCSTIIMLDDANSADKTFVQYWPDAGEITYGAMTITCQDETYAHLYNMRQFTLSHQKQKNSISVQQYAFNARSCKKKQPDGNKLAECVAFSRNKLSSKTLVHCKNGVGLCAVYVIAMSQIESLSMEGACDVFLSAHRLRKQNKHILQSQEEYALCFQLLRNYYTNEADYLDVY